MIRFFLRFGVTALAFVPIAASAHIGVGDPHGFVHGFSHALSGVDHLLAMIGVGVFAAHLGGRALWLLPSSFVSVMTLASFAGMAGVALPFVDIGIGMSVVVLGLGVATRANLQTLVAMSLVGSFAIFHGHAHGTEMPAGSSGLLYGLGFVCASALLHATGIALGMVIGKPSQPHSRRMVQVGGVAMAIAGVAMVISP